MDNASLNELISKIKSNEEDTPDAVNDFINRNLSQSQAHTVNRILSDPQLISQLLSSEQAQKLLKKFTDGEV